MRTNLPLKFSAITFLSLFGAAFPGTLNGTFTFTDSPPNLALIYFTDDHSLGKPAQTVISQQDKQFDQKMIVGAQGTKVVFKNSDNVDHNIYANDLKTGVNFDAGLLPPGQDAKVDLSWDDGKVVKIGCKIHPRMQAYVANTAGSHSQVVEFKPTDRTGIFKLEGVPDGASKLRVWFPRHDVLEVTLEKGKSAKLDITEKGKVHGTLSLDRK
ncbi:MAG TPA: hypothetical protein VK465_13515 [Fibrobacteria bacterium]|nr:hypothetical protein [Fibrobacteria bacterium]